MLVSPTSVRKVGGRDMQDLKVLKNAFLLFDKGRIVGLLDIIGLVAGRVKKRKPRSFPRL